MSPLIRRLAIDPGGNGGIVSSAPSFGNSPTAIRMPDNDEDTLYFLRHTFDKYASNLAYLEDVVLFTGTPMPGSRGIKYGASWGYLKGALEGIGYDVRLVPPKKWQAALNLGSAKQFKNKTQWKNYLKEMAQAAFPKLKVTLATADALLIYQAASHGLL